MDCYPWHEISDRIKRTALHAHDDLDEEGGEDDGESKELHNDNEERLRLEVSIYVTMCDGAAASPPPRPTFITAQVMPNTLRFHAISKGHIALRRWTIICMDHCWYAPLSRSCTAGRARGRIAKRSLLRVLGKKMWERKLPRRRAEAASSHHQRQRGS